MNAIRNHLIFPVLIICGIGFVGIGRSGLDEYLLSIINFVGIYVILAVSLNITNGFAGLFSLGHPGFMAIGGYVTAILTFPVARKSMFLELPQWLANLQLPFIPALIIGGFIVFSFLTDPGMSGGWKLVISAFYLGLAGLFVSVLRQRLIERKTDKYKDVDI